MAKKKDTEVEGFTLVNEAKLRRVLEGTVTREGALSGGIGKDADPALIRAHYDKLAGLILKGNRKVRTGSFWDFEKNIPRETPDVVFEHRTASGELFEYSGEIEPVEVIAEKKTRARKRKTEE